MENKFSLIRECNDNFKTSELRYILLNRLVWDQGKISKSKRDQNTVLSSR